MYKMNKLNELIQQFCPDGVEYKTLGEIATDIERTSNGIRDSVRSLRGDLYNIRNMV